MQVRLIAAGVFAALVSWNASGFELIRGGKPSATLVVADKAADAERFAAAELQAFLEKATGAKLAIVGKLPAGGQPVVLVGQTTVREAGEEFVTASQLAQIRDDGYAISTMAKQPALLLVGKEPRGTLYAVYDLLEAELGCGFFVDGDHVPQRSDVVLRRQNILGNPAFTDRTYYVPLGLYGPKRFQATLWNAEDWKPFLRWMAKKKMNSLAIPFTLVSRAWGTAFDQAFPEAKGQRPEVLEGVDAKAGVTARMGYGLNPEYTTALLKDVFAYARQTLGLKITYVYVYGEFEQSLRKAMPNLAWQPPYPASYPAAAGGSCALAPSEPRIRELQAKLWKAIVDTYGTDHSYVVCGEPAPRMAAASQSSESRSLAAIETMRQVDPKAQIRVPSWEAPSWGNTPEARSRFISQLPPDVGFLYWDPDLGALRRKLDLRFVTEIERIDSRMAGSYRDTVYTAADRLAGRSLAYAVPWSDGPNDDLFTNRFWLLANCFHHFNHLIPAPKAVGFWNWHDLRRVNPMMDDLCAEFAWGAAYVWRAEGAQTNRAVSNYLQRRYAPAAIFPMAEAQKEGLRGAPRPETGVNYRAYTGWGSISAPGSSAARTAVALALACKPAAGASLFYEADLVDLGRNYLHQHIQESCNRVLAIVRDAKRAAATNGYSTQVKEESLAALQKAEKQLLAAHKALSRLIATRKDMCLDDAILEATATKGANKLLAQAIREQQSPLFNDGYALTDTLEYHQQVAGRQLQQVLDYARRELGTPTADAVPGWESFFRQGAEQYIEKSDPVAYDKKAEKAAASAILQEFLESAE
ncbi:MAG TPA: alpha-glucuronidase family glycosyl hydrolase [Planctomycetota bacterium]|nr:alpha-glucuronidase family glycosyl hydrolase [Planctomycetota bacterium]HRR79500.1 alpha-glucuronidase family glycosyl hydrolase [Planctomycetota bacterium]HRT95258.1 alpha-glucuronidase family glycosyl hydrolase [Planctomycetota bacterium]